MRKKYASPLIQSEKSFESSALACAKTTDPPPGSWHFAHAYDTFSGHFGPVFGAFESNSDSVGLGFGPGNTSRSYPFETKSGIYGHSGLCLSYITFAS